MSQSQGAQPQFAGDTIDEVVVLGSRTNPRSATQTPAPADFLAQDALQATTHGEAGRAIQALAPSFNFPSTSIADGTDALKPATLRGLGPDQTLIMVNGLRRHKSALIHVNGSVGRGTAGTDMNAIPPSFLAHVEILRDGASALYGSDAIAGVVNLQLRSHSDGEATATIGQTTEGDGETQRIAINRSFDLPNNGFIFLGIDWRDNGKTNRAGLSGTRLYDPPVGTSNADTCNATDKSGCDPRESTANRDNFIVGDPETIHRAHIVHIGGRVGVVDLGAFVLVSDRDNESTGFFREPDDGKRNVASIYPDGFLPEINTDIGDSALGLSAEFALGQWDTRLAFGQGENSFDFHITNSLNASFGTHSPRDADSGGLRNKEQVVDAELRRAWDAIAIAAGIQTRTETYAIRAGELLSYIHCTEADARALLADATQCDAGNAAGIQVFPGFKPKNALRRERSAASAFGEIAFDSDPILVLGAVRFENYDGFDSVATGRIGAHWRITEAQSLRTTASTGFRAPAMHQLYFNNVSTQFNEGVGTDVLTARNDSALARGLGIPTLREETATNIGIGYVFAPLSNFSLTLDAYQIDIDDRIILSAQVEGVNLSAQAQTLYQQAGVSKAQFFINGPATQTRGADIVAEWKPNFAEGQLTTRLAVNVTNTEVTESFAPPGLLSGVTADALFTQRDHDIIESWQPDSRTTLSLERKFGAITLSTALNRYGAYRSSEGSGAGYKSQKISATNILDLRAHYDFGRDDGTQFRLTLRGDNVLDAYPDEDVIANSRGGTILGIVDSPNGVFRYSRRTAPFGFNGAFWALAVTARF